MLFSRRPTRHRAGYGLEQPSSDWSRLTTISTLAEAIDAIGEVESDYPRHALHATEIAHEYFDADTVLQRLLDKAMT